MSEEPQAQIIIEGELFDYGYSIDVSDPNGQTLQQALRDAWDAGWVVARIVLSDPSEGEARR